MKVSAKLVKELRDRTAAGMMDCKKALEATDCDIDKSIEWLRERGITKAAKKADRVAAEGLCSFEINGNECVVFEINSETDFVAKNEKFTSLVSKVGELLVNSTVKNTEEALALEVEGKTVADILIDATATIGEKISLRRVSRIEKTDAQAFGAYKHMGGRIATVVLVDGASEECARDIAMHVAAINPKYLSKDDIPADVVASEEEVLLKKTLLENSQSDKPKPEKIIQNIVKGRLNKTFKEACLLSQPFVKDPNQTVEQYAASNKCNVVSFIRLEVGEGIEKEVVDFATEVAAQAGLK